jgi:hypothetical protein
MRCLPTLAAGQPGFFGGEPVRGALAMCRPPSFARDLPLFIAVHSSESPSLSFRHGLVLSRAVPRTNEPTRPTGMASGTHRPRLSFLSNRRLSKSDAGTSW